MIKSNTCENDKQQECFREKQKIQKIQLNYSEESYQGEEEEVSQAENVYQNEDFKKEDIGYERHIEREEE